MRSRGNRLYLLTFIAALTTGTCARETTTNEPVAPPKPGVIEFEALIDPSRGIFEITQIGTTARGLQPPTVVQDGVPGSGPAQTIELVTTNVATDTDGSGACGFPSSFCADVTIRSFYTGPLNNVYSEITAISPAAGHTGLNSDAPPPGLSDALGLWAYGGLAGGGGTSLRQWVFGDDGTAYRVTGRVMADLCANGIQDGDETGVDCGGSECAACPMGITIAFPLQNSQENPATTSGARGSCTATYDEATNALDLSCTHNVISPTMAHIHTGAPGVNGGILIDLGAPASPINFSTTLTDPQEVSFLAGTLYVNVHSAANPGGDIRGQMSSNVLSFPVLPRQEVPPATNSNGAGTCRSFLSPDQTSLALLCTHNLTGGAAPTMAHIHQGAVGVNGPIIFNLGTGATPLSQTVTLDAAQLAAFLSGNYYVNFHTTAFMAGEMRGQMTQFVESRGDGDQEVPPSGSAATMVCRSYLSPDQTSLSVSCTHDVAAPTMAHIHSGAPGVNGGILINLGAGTSPITGTFPVTAPDVAAFQAGDLYFNVHNAANPGGDVRAQISTNWNIPLSGPQHIPATASANTGDCLVHMNPGETTLRLNCTHTIPDATAAHLHLCSATCPGPIYTPNFPSATSPFSATVNLVSTDPNTAITGQFYVHVHSTTFPSGEIRGQISDVYEFGMDGAQAVPPHAGGFTGACFGFLSYAETPTFVARCTHDVPAPASAHLHRGPPGTAGPVLQTVIPNANSPINWQTTFGAVAAGFIRGGETYMDVHDATSVACRGQVVP